MKCRKCKGRGKLTDFYCEVLDARGPFYDRDLVRDIRMITMQCRTCKGTGEIGENAQIDHA